VEAIALVNGKCKKDLLKIAVFVISKVLFLNYWWRKYKYNSKGENVVPVLKVKNLWCQDMAV
jgi:hypothetical protein